MKLFARCLHVSIGALSLVAAANAGSGYALVGAKIGTGGGGALSGGSYAAYTTLAADGPAGPMQGGPYQITSGLERRRDTIAPEAPIFRDGFDG